MKFVSYQLIHRVYYHHQLYIYKAINNRRQTMDAKKK